MEKPKTEEIERLVEIKKDRISKGREYLLIPSIIHIFTIQGLEK